ncbi:MAG TPA: nitroreductase family protein [Candidatus Paceibacterota bacterium]
MFFVDETLAYDEIKDAMSIGATIQNMLLAASWINIGTCWIGDIISNVSIISDYFDMNSCYTLLGAVSLGYFISKSTVIIPPKRYDIHDMVLEHRK